MSSSTLSHRVPTLATLTFLVAATPPAFAWHSCNNGFLEGRYSVEGCADYTHEPPADQISFTVTAVGAHNDSTRTVVAHAFRENGITGHRDQEIGLGTLKPGQATGPRTYKHTFDGSHYLVIEFVYGDDLVDIVCGGQGCAAGH